MKKRRPILPPAAPAKNRPRPLAQSPGSLVHRGEKQIEEAQLRLFAYDAETFDEETFAALPESGLGEDAGRVRWLHFTGLHDVAEVAKVGRRFGVAALVLEDILHTGSRSKIENHPSGIFVVMRLVSRRHGEEGIEAQHFSLLLLPGNLVLTFAEKPTTVFDPVIERIRTSAGGRIRRHGADYLTWALLDAVVDNYLHVIDRLDESVVEMDDRLEADERSVEAAEIHALKREINGVFRSIRPVREIAASFLRENEALLTGDSRPFFIDLHDHAIQCLETIEYLREASSALRELLLSSGSHRMNEVMKVLACFSALFLPLTFIAGVYGMNFEHMPELRHPWGYAAVWVVFLLCSAGMLWLFRRMRWL